MSAILFLKIQKEIQDKKRISPNTPYKFRKSRTWKKLSNHPKKPYFKKRNKKDEKEKQECTCWVCHEKGHYANKCLKQTFPTNTKLLRVVNEVLEEDFEVFKVIQRDFETELEIYSVEEDSLEESLETESSSESETEFSFCKMIKVKPELT